MLKNGEAVRLKLYKMKENLEDAAREALDEASQAALDRAREIVPVDTGRLRASLDVRKAPNKAYLYAQTEYAAAVELGTSRAPAQPYLMPSAQSAADILVRRAAEGVGRIGGKS